MGERPCYSKRVPLPLEVAVPGRGAEGRPVDDRVEGGALEAGFVATVGQDAVLGKKNCAKRYSK